VIGLRPLAGKNLSVVIKSDDIGPAPRSFGFAANVANPDTEEN